MSYGYLLAGIVLGACLLGGVLLFTDQDVNADRICNDRLEGNWSGEQVNTDFGNQSMTVQCTNGERVENLSVSVNVEVVG